jgi:hypothetical protein
LIDRREIVEFSGEFGLSANSVVIRLSPLTFVFNPKYISVLSVVSASLPAGRRFMSLTLKCNPVDPVKIFQL